MLNQGNIASKESYQVCAHSFGGYGLHILMVVQVLVAASAGTPDEKQRIFVISVRKPGETGTG